MQVNLQPKAACVVNLLQQENNISKAKYIIWGGFFFPEDTGITFIMGFIQTTTTTKNGSSFSMFSKWCLDYLSIFRFRCRFGILNHTIPKTQSEYDNSFCIHCDNYLKWVSGVFLFSKTKTIYFDAFDLERRELSWTFLNRFIKGL